MGLLGNSGVQPLPGGVGVTAATTEASNRARLMVLYVLITIAFISKLIDSFVVTLHLVDEAIVVALALLLVSTRKLTVPKEWLIYIGILYVGALLGIATPQLASGFPAMPIIPAYHSVSNFIISAVYESRYVISMGVLLGCGLVLTEKQWQRISAYILVFLVTNALASIVEYFWPPLHATLEAHAHYPGHFSFVYRGVSLLMNVYDASMSMIFLIGLSVYKWLARRRRIFLLTTIIGIVAMLLLGTRTGYITMIGYFVFLSFLTPMSVRRRILAVSLTFVLMMMAIGALFVLSRTFREILVSIVLLRDKSGSAQTHVALFLRTLELIVSHPFGVGIGKINFGSFVPGVTYEPESWALALGLDCGLLVVPVFYYYNLRIVLRIFRTRRPGASALAAVGLSLLALSVINMQVFGSALTMVLLPTLAATFLGVQEPTDAAIQGVYWHPGASNLCG